MDSNDIQLVRGLKKRKGKLSLTSDLQVLSNRYGKFYAQPFERGFGTTIGNCLRRALLSSIEGAAITAVKIEGVLHEFSSIPGVVEDATDIILNLKRIPFRLHGSGPKLLRVERSTPGEMLSGEIEADWDVDILEPNVHIATVLEGGRLAMEMRLKRGRGYVSAERNFDEDLTVGYIPIASVHSPVKKINYTVESARLGQDTDYDKLIIEIWTNGSVKPENALGLASKLIKDHMQIFINFEEEPELAEADSEESSAKMFNENLDRSVDELKLSVRSYNSLKNADIRTIRELVQKSEAELLHTRKLSRRSLNEVKEILHSMGLNIGMEFDEQERIVLDDVGSLINVEDDVMPWFFQSESESAIKAQIEWIRERLNLDDQFFSKLLKIEINEFSGWRSNHLALSLEGQNVLKEFWQTILHLLSYLGFNSDLVQRMLNNKDERERGSIRLPFDPPWIGTSIKEYLETSGPTGISEVNRWVLSFRFADRHQIETEDMACP